MPPRDPKPANSGRKPKPKLDVPEPALTNMLEKYCDLRRRPPGGPTDAHQPPTPLTK